MPYKERVWFLRRLNEQIKKENDEIKKATKGKGRKGPKLPTGRRRK